MERNDGMRHLENWWIWLLAAIVLVLIGSAYAPVLADDGTLDFLFEIARIRSILLL